MAAQTPGNRTHETDPAPSAEPGAAEADAGETAGRRPRPAGRLVAVAVVLTAVAAVVVITLPSWLVSPAGVRQFLLRSLPELNGDVKVEAAAIGWFSPLSIRGLSLVPPEGGSPPISVKQITGDRGLLAILMERGRLGRIGITGLELDLVFDQQHVSNLQRLIGRPPQRRASVAVPDQPPAVASTETAAGDERVRVAVTGGLIRVRGPWTQDRWESEPIDLEATLRRTAAGDREWSLAPVKLLDHARLEPSVAAGVLAYAAPILADATRTSGEFSLVIDEARWPAGRGEEATVSGVLTLHEVDVGPGPLVKGLVQSLPGRLPAPPTIRVAEASRVQFRQADRRVWHEGLAFGLPLAEPGQRLDIESTGSVGLDDRSVDLTLSLPIPADLPQDRPLLAAVAGKTLRLQVEGNLDEPRLKLDESLKQTVTAVAGDVLENLRKKRAAGTAATTPEPVGPEANPTRQAQAAGGQPAPAASPAMGTKDPDSPTGTAAKLNQLKGVLPPEMADDPTTDAVIGAVGGLLDEVARRRAARKQEQETKDQPQPPAGEQADPKRNRPARRLLRQLLDAADAADAAGQKPKEESAADQPPPSKEPRAPESPATE
jgi:hypothetical protein